MDIVTLGAALNGSAEYVNSHFKGGSNIQIVGNPDGTQTINASGEVSAEDTVARADIAAIKDGESLDSFADVETALGSKQDTISDLSTIRSGAALGATAVQPETGKGLSTNDYTTTEKTKLAGIAEGAEVNVQANWTQTTPTADDYIKNKPTLGTAAALDVAASGNASTSQVVKGNDTRLTDARNAADVSSWAKAANKPSYNGSEIALTGYAEAQSKSSVAATDTANAAIGKLEYRVETNENNILFNARNGVANVLANTATTTTAANGLTYTVNADKSVTVTGNSSAYNAFTVAGSRTYANAMPLKRGTYIIKAGITYDSSKPIYVQFGIMTSSGASISWQNIYDTNKELVVDNDTTRIVYEIYNPSGSYSGYNATFYPMIIDKSLYEAGVTDYQPYAMSNAELTAKEQVNENNILSNWGGAKNLATITSGTFTAPSGTRYTTIPLSQPISGEVVVYFGSLTSDDTQGSTCAVVVSTATETLSTINMERGSGRSATVTLTGEATKILIYPAAGYSTSSGKTVTWSNLMVCSKADWDKTQAYSAPAMSNVELTEGVATLNSNAITAQGTILSQGANLNSITTAGVYRANTNALADSLYNCPTQYSFRLEVSSTASGARPQQIIYPATNDGKMYRRVMSSTSGTWFDWYEYNGTVVQSIHVPT